MKRLLICLNKRELFDAKSKKCLQKLTDEIISLTSQGHVLVILPIINIRLLKQDLENDFLFESELATIIVKNSIRFFDGQGKFSNPLVLLPQIIRELNIQTSHVIIVDTFKKMLDEANNYGYATLKVPNIESPVYEKYIDKLKELAKILYRS